MAVAVPLAEAPDTSGQPRERLGREWRMAALIVAATVLSSPVTLQAALADLRYQSPVAELAFIPVVGLVMAAFVLVRYPYVSSARLGAVDVLLATFLLSTAGALQAWALVQPGSYAWVLRFDALSLPLAVTAGITLCYGIRSLVAFWPVVAYLFLSWPLPAGAFVELIAAPVTATTSTLVDGVLAMIPAAPEAVRQGTDLVVHGTSSNGDFDVAVTSACSGINGMLGFLVVGLGLLFLYRGSLTARLKWLAAGLALVMVLNVVRILVLIAVAMAFGSSAAFDTLHAGFGLLLLNVAALTMALSSARFGLIRRPWSAEPSDNPLHAEGRLQTDRRLRLRRRAVALLVAAALLGALNVQMASAAPAYRNSALPTIHSLTGVLKSAASIGYTVRHTGEQRWARKYFGSDARWDRFILEPRYREIPTVWVDILDTNSMASLRTHSTMQCYRLHEQDVLSRRSVSLSDGVLVDVLSVRMNGAVWHVVTWERPIQRGSRVAHERVTLMASSQEATFAREFRHPSERAGLRDRLVAGLNALRPKEDPNPPLSRNLLALADEWESRGTGRAAGGTS